MYNNIRKNNEKRESKRDLVKFLEAKIKTTMIGAISDIEKHFGPIINTDEGFKAFEVVRQEILDRGNQQIRKMKDEIDLYDINLNSNILKNVLKKED